MRAVFLKNYESSEEEEELELYIFYLKANFISLKLLKSFCFSAW
jgi:hypothetical protein